MPDLDMCKGGDCPMKDKCYRFTATPSEHRQYYFLTPPIVDGKCDSYIEAWSKSQIRRLDVQTRKND